jgi:hypothetical protein
VNYLRRLLNGRIKYNQNYNFDLFTGYIKLSKDPKAENLSVDNILFAGQSLDYCEWMIGILLKVGTSSLLGSIN